MPMRQCSDWSTTQAFLYAAKVARSLGEHLIVRAGWAPYDGLAGRYFGPCEPSIGFLAPSVVHHRGCVTTGLSGLPPISDC